MTVSFPVNTLKPAEVTRQILARTTKGTSALTGFTQRVSVPAHVWCIEYNNITVSGFQIWAWDALEAFMDGGANPVLVPLVGENYGVASGTVFANAFAGDTFLQVTRVGEPILQGYHFSIGERLHRVVSVTPAGDLYTMLIRPPLRTDTPAGTFVGFVTLNCKCRLASDDEMKLKLNAARIGIGNIRFIEDLEL